MDKTEQPTMATKTFFSVTFKHGGHVDMVMPLKIRADHNFNFLFTIMYGLTILRAVQQALLYILGILQGRTEKMKVMKNSFFLSIYLIEQTSFGVNQQYSNSHCIDMVFSFEIENELGRLFDTT